MQSKTKSTGIIKLKAKSWENMQYLDILYSTQVFCKLPHGFWQCMRYWYVNEITGIMNIDIYLYIVFLLLKLCSIKW
jgi:hypothetical protein